MEFSLSRTELGRTELGRTEVSRFEYLAEATSTNDVLKEHATADADAARPFGGRHR